MEKRLLKTILWGGLLVCISSCNDADSLLDETNTPQGVNVEFDYSQAKLSRDAGSSAVLNGNSDVDWTVEVEDEDFFSVQPMSGSAGEFKLTITAESDNLTTDKVYSKFIFNASGRKYPITVIQLEDEIRIEPSYEEGTEFLFDKDGKLKSPTGQFTVSANTEWTVRTVNDEDSWVILGPEQGSIGESLPVSVAVEPNLFAKTRTASFEVSIPESSSYSYKVKQEPADFVYYVKNGDLVIDDTNNSIEVNGGGEVCTILMETNADWNITFGEKCDWLSCNPMTGSASSEETAISLSVEPNEDFSESRKGSFTINFGDDGVLGTVTIEINQKSGEMPEEVKSLKELETELEGADNTGALNWSEEIDYNNWTGAVFEAGKLVELNLSGKGLAGWIPEGISAFTSLRKIDLSANQLTANSSLAKIIIDKSVSGQDLFKDAAQTKIDQSYVPAIPVGIKDLLNLVEFKISGNNIKGIFPSDVVNNPNYLSWDAMRNIFPQNGVTYDAISYIPDSNERYDASKTNADPSKWGFKLNQIGILRVMYYAMGGVNWTSGSEPVGEPEWLNKEFIIAQSWNGTKNQYPFGEENPKFTAVAQVGGNQDVQKFEVGSVSGYIPEECLMNSGLAHFWIDSYDANYKLTGSIHPLIIQRLNYINLKNHDLDMNVNLIFANLRNSVVNIAFQNNARIYGQADFTLLNTSASGKKVSKGPFSFAGTSITGSVSVSAITCFKEAMTKEEWLTKVPSTVTVND